MSDRDAHRLEPLLRETHRGQAQARNELLGRLLTSRTLARA
ncbi:MAG TPA: hypothetical protein VKD72_16795 [Gemmataceae bacterium]|nr:hypothetical protein [Gemmataceae bacterium]